ncbi:methylated-DNA--[protein]-cysteine S-methyltransferase [Pseudactinotalea sp. HY158]|uniref:methylated-DNA--[protein]-cysteine S-methyltransferase n=1 Tax=Pseudactinotalea sp. HY158 TaxID=2654547 RepID=UPI00129C68D3|nr:methylated-DNA--[protein]-cysteine S-methyltransferase [Pseudactinotalea sp. HY158]QGH70156.1 methylated-DNA--[protein]-cysteine S-methyltransferase [Pseudactinotalea sp. HY158]
MNARPDLPGSPGRADRAGPDGPGGLGGPALGGPGRADRAAPDATDGELFPVTHADLARLHARLEASAQAEAILDVRYRVIDSPIGPLLLAATARGLVRVAFEREGFEAVLSALAGRIGARILETPTGLAAAARELAEYFAGDRRAFDLTLDHALSAGFRERVQRSLPQIAYGHTRSYREVAASVGSPGAVRAVGTACATNPLPVVVPCHRVLRSDGTLGGYVGGLEAKAALLALERAA